MEEPRAAARSRAADCIVSKGKLAREEKARAFLEEEREGRRNGFVVCPLVLRKLSGPEWLQKR